MITILQLIGLFIILGFAGHLYIELEKMYKLTEQHIEKLDNAINDYIAKREAQLSKIEASFNQ